MQIFPKINLPSRRTNPKKSQLKLRNILVFHKWNIIAQVVVLLLGKKNNSIKKYPRRFEKNQIKFRTSIKQNEFPNTRTFLILRSVLFKIINLHAANWAVPVHIRKKNERKFQLEASVAEKCIKNVSGILLSLKNTIRENFLSFFKHFLWNLPKFCLQEVFKKVLQEISLETRLSAQKQSFTL